MPYTTLFRSDRNLFHDLGNNEAPDPVIDGPAHDAVLVQFHRAIGVNCGVAHPDAEGPHLVDGGRPDIHPELVGLRRLLVGEILELGRASCRERV